MAEGEGQDSGTVEGGENRVSYTRKILVALDDGDESEHALIWSLNNGIVCPRGSSSDTVILLHAQTQPQVLVGYGGPGTIHGFFITPEIIDSVRRQQEDISRKVLTKAKKICDERNVNVETMVAFNDPRDAICEAVEKLHCDFLVIGSHGYGAVKRTLLGSVSDYCVHNAKCPVVIVKKPA
eukprot:c22619_g1_i2 orf=233-775(+)